MSGRIRSNQKVVSKLAIPRSQTSAPPPMLYPTQEQCRNPTLTKCEDETHTPKVGDLESSGTPECLEFDSKGQNTSPWGVLSVIGKVLKCRCPKWPRIGHLDIYRPSYGQKKGRESNWQFDSRPLKVGNRPLSDVRIQSAIWHWKDLDEGYNFGVLTNLSWFWMQVRDQIA
jgi:hypothetical protein